MKQAIRFGFSIIVAFTFVSCHKTNSDDSGILYGKWSKGTSFGDTLFFFQKDGRNILSYQVSFNPAFPAPTETDYSYANGKLQIRLLGPQGSLESIESFKWIEHGKKFEIQGIELCSFLSSTQVYFTYNKLQ